MLSFRIGWRFLHANPAHNANKPIRSDEPIKGSVTINTKNLETRLQYFKRNFIERNKQLEELNVASKSLFRRLLSWIHKLLIFVKSNDNMQEMSDFSH